MKKSITAFLVILLLFSFTACSKNPENVQQTENQPQTEANTETEQQNTEEEKDMQKIVIEIGSKTFTATLYDNETARALTQLLPMTLNMSELNGNEKYYYLDNSLPTDPQRPSGIKTGDIMLYGRGAGSLPTGSAIVSDIIYAATHTEIKYSTFKNEAEPAKDTVFAEDFESAYYLRLSVDDEQGVLAKITSALGKNHISIAEMLQRKREGGKASIVLVTHETHELAVRNAVEKINSTQIATVESVVRVAS